MPGAHLDWHGDEAHAYVQNRAVKFIALACLTVVRHAKELLSVSGTVSRGRRQNADRNPPGEPPRKVTGRLRSSVTMEIDEEKMTGRVGTNVLYGFFNEVGTRFMQPRPWLSRSLNEVRGKVDEFLSQIGED